MDDIILRFSLICGLSGMMFGIDTGLFPAIMMHFEKNFKSVDAVKVVTNVSAVIGAGLGGFLSDLYGRKFAIKSSEVLYVLGSLLSVWPPFFPTALLGRLLIGLGIGLASVSCSLYVSEISPPRIRGKLVSIYGVCMQGGYLLSNGIIQFSVKSPSWVWLLGSPSIPVAIHFCFICQLLESPRWLMNKGKFDEALEILKKLFPASEVPNIYNQMRDSVGGSVPNVFTILKKKNFQRALLGSISVQTAHSIGAKGSLNHGKLDPSSDSLIFSALMQLIGSIGTVFTIDKYGRRKIVIVSLFASVALFQAMSITSFYSAQSVAAVHNEAAVFGNNSLCNNTAVHSVAPHSWNCLNCLENGCIFCSSPVSKVDPGACLLNSNATRSLCVEKGRKYLYHSCPSNYGYLTGAFLTMSKLVHSLGLSIVPAVVTAEIFPLQHLGLGAGLGSMFGWVMNLIGAMIFSLAKIESLWVVYSIQTLSAAGALLFINICLPETGGLPLEERSEHSSIP